MKNEKCTPVIVAYGRSAIGKAIKGSLAATHPVNFAAQTLNEVLARVPQLDKSQIDDLIVGCAMPFGKQGMNMARLIALRAGLPYEVSAQTVNRYCSSGLQTIATACNAIAAGQADVIVAGGVEQMTAESMLLPVQDFEPVLAETEPGAYMTMGITAENVAAQYSINRAEMDEFAAISHARAAAAIESGNFKDEIVPINVVDADGNTRVFDADECVRKGTTAEKLGGLKTVFLEDGTVTAGNASQLSDGAAFVVVMSLQKAEELGVKPIAKLAGFTVAGVAPEIMGIGPIAAIPKLMRKMKLETASMDVMELNEAFAAQALACIKELGLNTDKVNPNGGAIALGHPLGATGAILVCKALAQLKRQGGRYGMVSMCIGGGMGAAGILEML